MGLTRQSGSSTTGSASNSGTPGEVTPKDPSEIAHMPFISDSNLNKFAIDTSQYASVTKQLVGFIKGKRSVVTYYRLLNREGYNVRSNVADLPNARNITESEYQKIVNLEITLSKEFDFEANNEDASVKITGQAVFYPNMNPNIGDMFLLGMGDSRVGLCRVSNVTPMTWRTDRVYSINFLVQEFLEEAVSLPLEASVVITSYFSKENYLGGTAALLSEDSFVGLAKIKEQRVILSQMYHQMFYSKDVGSYLKPDGKYDPWVVMFMCGKLRMEDVFQRPRNLLGDKKDIYAETFWERLENGRNNTMMNLSPRQAVREYNQTRMGSFVTRAHNSPIIYPSVNPTDETFYVFTSSFYSGATESMSSLELLVYEAIKYKTSGSLSTLITEHLDPVFALTKDEQFYKIPICIHLIDMALQSQYREIDAPAMDYATNGGV